jgi:hypothetical protein
MNIRKYINLFEDTAGITDAWFKTDSFQTYKQPNPERYEIAREDGVIQTLEGPVNYKKGYYILTGPKGEQYPMPPEKFRELKDDAGDGVCYPKKIIKLAKLADHDGSVATSWGASLILTIKIITHSPLHFLTNRAHILFKDTMY